MTASDRRILFTKWVGQAWQETSRRLKETVISHSFVKCSIALPTSGCLDKQINLEGLSNYGTIGKSAIVEDIVFILMMSHPVKQKLIRKLITSEQLQVDI